MNETGTTKSYSLICPENKASSGKQFVLLSGKNKKARKTIYIRKNLKFLI